MRTRAAAAATSLAVLLAGCDPSPGETTETTTIAAPCTAATATATTSVSLAGMMFVPYCVRVAPGAEVTFANLDAVDHTATADAAQPDPFESGLLRPGQRFAHRFGSAAATVRVHCRLHPEMSGIVIVQ